jgi:hypothetical protein
MIPSKGNPRTPRDLSREVSFRMVFGSLQCFPSIQALSSPGNKRHYYTRIQRPSTGVHDEDQYGIGLPLHCACEGQASLGVMQFWVERIPTALALACYYGHCVDGFNDYLYQHNDDSESSLRTDWPTLGELVQADTCILLFYYTQPDCNQQVCPRGFHFWFQYGVNTQFDFGDIDDLLDTGQSCELTAVGANANSKRDFFSRQCLCALSVQSSRRSPRRSIQITWIWAIMPITAVAACLCKSACKLVRQ